MRRLLILLPMLVMASVSALADGLDVNWREAKVVRLAKPATSVIIGDPTVADVTLDDPTTMVVFGKTPGETNIIVLSGSQELLANWALVVTPATERHVTVLNAQGEKAPIEVLYSCGPERCVRVLSPSDVQFNASTTTSTSSNTDASKSSSSNAEPTGAPAAGTANAAGGQTAPATDAKP